MSERDDAPDEPALYRAFLLKSLEQLGERIDRLDESVHELRKSDDARISEVFAAREKRQRGNLLARMAGNIASGLAALGPRKSEDFMRDEIADAAVDIAERILRRIGL